MNRTVTGPFPNTLIRSVNTVATRTHGTCPDCGQHRQTPLTHDGLDSHRETAGRAADHLRALLEHHGLLPHQDPYLNRFEA